MAKILTRPASIPQAQTPYGADPYQQAEQAALYAEAMKQRALQPIPQHFESTGQNVGRGLTQLAQALLARRAGKQANAAQTAADAQTRTGVNKGIEALTQAMPVQGQIDSVDGEAPTPLAGGGNYQGMAQALQNRGNMHAALDNIDPRAGQAVVAQALLQRAMPPDPMQAAQLQLQRDTLQGNQEERKANREQRIEELRLRIEDSQKRGQDANDLRRELAKLTAETAAAGQANTRAIAEMNDATRRAEVDRKIEADRAKAPATTSGEAAQGFLANAGYDPKTQEDDITKLLKTATGGLMERGRDMAARSFNKTTEGAASSQALKSRASEAVLGFLGGKLGAGVSNADRDFMMQRAGDVGNEKLSTGERLAAWKDVRERMIRQAGGTPPASIALAPPAAGALTPAEQSELDALRARFKK